MCVCNEKSRGPGRTYLIGACHTIAAASQETHDYYSKLASNHWGPYTYTNLGVCRCVIAGVMIIIDLQRQMLRYGVPYREPLAHPQKTVTAMRLLSAITNQATRVKVSHNLYQVHSSGCLCQLTDINA